MENLRKFWKKKKVLITGHTGFKGSCLSIILNFLNSKIYGYSLAPKNMGAKKGHGLYNPYLQVKNGMQGRFTDVPECLGKNVIQVG